MGAYSQNRKEDATVEDIDRKAFRRGFKDYQTYAKQREAGLHSPIWRPVEGHEEAYAAGWETARVREAEGRRLARAA